jgi:nitrogen fixation NifU-like protein
MLDELRDLYQEVILDHGRSPRNFRHPPDATCEAHGQNPLCGDMVTVFLRLTPAGIIDDVAFEGKGCAISTASASIMTETLKGKSIDEAKRLFEALHRLCTEGEAAMNAAELEAVDGETMDRLMVLAGVRQFPMRVKCATLPWHTMKAALSGEAATTTE